MSYQHETPLLAHGHIITYLSYTFVFNVSFLIFVRADRFQKPWLDMEYDAIMSLYLRFYNMYLETQSLYSNTYSGVPETQFFSFLMHLCDMQVNRISMESAKCAQSNKTCHQSEIWYLFDKIRVKRSNYNFLLFLQ
jgi:hypothetical protein